MEWGLSVTACLLLKEKALMEGISTELLGNYALDEPLIGLRSGYLRITYSFTVILI